MEIRKANRDDLPALVELGLRLWPGHNREELEADFAAIMAKKDAVFFLAWAGQTPAGFAQCQLRHDYVEGTESSPVGYLEGIFVEEDFRRRGLAGQLLEACQLWAKEHGCREFASDCELDNAQSLMFHLKLGFSEANRIICFAKKL